MASPAPAGAARAPWREQVGSFLVQRREREVNAHKAFFNAYAVLASTAARLLAENAGLRSQNETLRAEATLSGSAAASGSQGGPQVQARLLELQTEITGLYRAQAAAVQERLALSESNQRLKEESQKLAAAHARMESSQRSILDETDRLRAALKEKEARLEVLVGELMRTREQLSSKASEADTLREENSAIVERVMNAKAAAAEQVQAVNELLDTTRRERDRAQESFLRAKAHIDALTRALAEAATGTPGATGVPQPIVDSFAIATGAPTGATTAQPHVAAMNARPSVAAPPPTPPASSSNPVASLFGTLSSAIRAATSSGVKPPPVAGQGHVHNVSDAEVAATAGAAAGLMSDYVMAFLPVPSRVAATLRAHESEINAVRFSDTSRVVATACSDGNVGLFDAASGARVGHLSSAVTGNACLCVDVCAGVTVAGCTDRSVRVWDMATQRLTRSYTGHAGKVHAVVYLPTANSSGGGGSGRGVYVSGSADRSVKLWDARDGRCLRTIDTKSIVNSVAVSADGMYIAVANQDSGVRLFDSRTGAKMLENARCHSAAVTSVQFSRGDGGARLLTASRDNTLRLLDARTLEPMHAFVPPSAAMVGGATASTSVLGMLNSLSGTGSSGSSGEAPSGIVMKQSMFRLPSNQSRAVLSPNNLMAACGGANGYVYTFSCETGDMEAELGNTRAAAAKQRKERVAATAEGRGHTGGRASSAAAEDDASMFGGAFASLSDAPSASRFDEPHEGRPVLCVDWSGDGSYIASADESGKLVLWSS